MGCCYSYASKSTTTTSSFKGVVRVVHLDGYVQHLSYPVTVAHLIGDDGDSPRHVVCTPLQLLSSGFLPMKSDALLQRGHVYFLLPYSALQADASPLDLSSLVRKLMVKAKAKDSARQRPPPPPHHEDEDEDEKDDMKKKPHHRSWKPVLETIREKSFNRRSESDLQEDRVPPPPPAFYL